MGNLAVNEKAPDFSLSTFQGNDFRLSDFKGERNILIVLNRGFV